MLESVKKQAKKRLNLPNSCFGNRYSVANLESPKIFKKQPQQIEKERVMNFATSLLIALIFMANLVFAQPSLADKPKFLKNPDYIEVTKALENLKAAQEAQAQTENYNPEEIQNKIGELEFQKYALETGINWGQCRNETGKTLAVYGPKPKFDDDDYEYQYDNGLYFLADGQTTKEKWDCQGVYLPGDVKISGLSDEQSQDIGGPIAVQIGDGTQLVIKSNSDTGAVEFSIPPSKVLKPGDVNWFIPNVSQDIIDARVANAPVAKNQSQGNNIVVMTKPEKETLGANTSPKAQLQPQPQEQSQPQPQAQPASLKANYPSRR